MAEKHAFLAAGGTGGHLFPAEALAHAMIARGWTVDLVTDERASRYAGSFPAREVFEVKSATLASKNPIALLKTFSKLWSGYRHAAKLLRTHRPSIVVGFGGYPTLPPLLAASMAKVPTLVHEQNSVMGRANALLASRVNRIALGFPPIKGDIPFADKTTISGNPVRPAVLEAMKVPYKAPSKTGKVNLVIFGGSQGAQYFSEVMPAALKLIAPKLLKRLSIVQQARPEDVAGVTEAYDALGVAYDVAPFFDNMAGHIAKAHWVMSRSGASTVSELSAIGRPSLLVPYPFALDHDQAANAAALEAEGGAEIIVQKDLTPEVLAQKLTTLIETPQSLSDMAEAAQKVGKPKAAETLADIVEDIVAKGSQK